MKHSISSRKSGQNGKLNTDKNTSLEHHFSEVKQENYSSTFPEVENWIYKANISLSNEKKLHYSRPVSMVEERTLSLSKLFSGIS